MHAAGRVSLRACGREAMRRLQVDGSRNVARAAKAAGVGRFVHVSSVGVLGAYDAPGVVDEDHPAPGALSQKHHYHRSKIEAEAAVTAELAGAMDLVCVLPVMLWGPGDWGLSSTGYALRALQGETLYFTRTGGTSVLDVEDAARGVVAALRRGRPGERYILAGENISIETLCRLIAEAIGGPQRVKPVALPVITFLGAAAEFLGLLGVDMDFSLDIRRQSGNYWWADGGKAKKELDFTWRWDARAAINHSVAWMKQNRDLLSLTPKK